MNAELVRLLPYLGNDDIEDVILIAGSIKKEPVKVRETVFRLSDLDDEFCFLNFRFHKTDLLLLRELLGIPKVITIHRATVVTGTEALCIVLRRLAYPNRYVDLMSMFGRSRSVLSTIFRHMIKFIIERHGHRLTNLDPNVLTLERLQAYADAVHAKGAPYKNCVGFIDGTVRPICRPSVNQKEFYNGHKRTHALKFQSIVTPDGLIIHLFGPEAGRRHDAHLLHKSDVIQQLQRQFNDQNGRPFHLYGDPAYPLLPHLLVGFRKHDLNPRKHRFNKRMSKVRECVEWEFGRVITQFAFLDFKKNQKILLQAVGESYIVGVFFANCQSCLYGNQTSQYFNLDPPSIQEYLA